MHELKELLSAKKATVYARVGMIISTKKQYSLTEMFG